MWSLDTLLYKQIFSYLNEREQKKKKVIYPCILALPALYSRSKTSGKGSGLHAS